MLAARISRAGAVVAIAVGLAVATAVTPPALAADPGPTSVAIIAPIVAPPGTTGLLDSTLLEQYTAPEGLLTRQLDAVIGRPVTLAIDPMIVASIRVLGAGAPVAASDWLARLEAAPNESFLLAYADADVALALEAGSAGVPAPQSFEFVIDPAQFAPETTATPSPSPSPTEDGGMPGLPSLDELLAWDATFDSIVWPRGGAVGTASLDALTASGFERVILSSANVTRDPSLGAAVTIGDQAVVVTDDAVSTALSAAATSLSPLDLDAALPAVHAAIAAAGSVQAGQGVVVAHLHRAVALSGSNVAQTISALQVDDAVRLVPLSEALAASTSGEASLVEGHADPDRVQVVRSLLGAEADEQRFATIAADPARLTSPRRLALLALLDIAWADNTAGWATATDEFLTTSVDIRESVQIVTASPFTLLADTATLPIPVSNSLNQAVTVYVTVRPETAQLAVTDSLVELTIEPNSQGKASIPVQAISNGTVQVLMTLSGASGVSVGQPAITEINVQAGWETPIVLVIGGLVVAVFAIGLVRNIVRRRRTAAISATADGEPGAAGSDD